MVHSHSLSLPWSISPEDERRFRRVLIIVLAVTIVLGAAIPMLPVFKKPVEQQVELPPRLARLIFEKRTEPKPVVKPKPVEKPKPKTKKKTPPPPKKQATEKVREKPKPKKPEVDAIEEARKKASSSGLLAMQDSLADLRDQSLDQLKGAQRLSNNGAQARQTERSMLTSRMGNASGGINTAAISRDTGATQLASRTATEVKSSITKPTSKSSRAGANRNASRSDEEIQLIFDRNKNAIYSLYNRALRSDPGLQGKLVLKLTIAPSGAVTHIEMVSSALGDAALEKKLLRRIKMINFGAKPVDTVTLTYPIEFLPA